MKNPNHFQKAFKNGRDTTSSSLAKVLCHRLVSKYNRNQIDDVIFAIWQELDDLFDMKVGEFVSSFIDADVMLKLEEKRQTQRYNTYAKS